MSAGPISTAILGFGMAGQIFHAPFVSAVPALALVGIMQRTGDTAAKAYPHVRIFRSVEEVFSSNVDLVVIGTPNETHFDFARRALLAGKHVVVDKPFAANSIEAKQLEALAAEKKRVLAVFHNRRWDGDFLTVRKLIDAQAVGRVVTLESHFDRFRPLPLQGTWKEQAGSFNGMLWDLGPHLIDQAISLFGKPETVTASVRADRDGSAIEDAFDITLRFNSDGHAIHVHVRATMLAAEAAPRFTLHGTHGTFIKHGQDPQAAAITAGAKVPLLTDTQTEWLGEPESAWGTLTRAENLAAASALTREKIRTELGDYRQFYVNVASAIRGESRLVVTPRDAIRTLRLMELVRESSRAARTLPITGDDW